MCTYLKILNKHLVRSSYAKQFSLCCNLLAKTKFRVILTNIEKNKSKNSKVETNTRLYDTPRKLFGKQLLKFDPNFDDVSNYKRTPKFTNKTTVGKTVKLYNTKLRAMNSQGESNLEF